MLRENSFPILQLMAQHQKIVFTQLIPKNSSNGHSPLAHQDKGEHEVFAISDGVVPACPRPAAAAYRSYPERWWLLLTVVLLNLANYSHWVAFPSVTKESYPQAKSLSLRFRWNLFLFPRTNIA